MIDRATVFVVVPARNEAPRIAEVVETMPEFVDRIVVVDDGSLDHTSAVAKRAGGARVDVVRHERSLGVGAAIAAGYAWCAAFAQAVRAPFANDVFAVMAGDGQMDPADLARVVGPVARGEAGYVKGNRFEHASAWRTMPVARRIAGEALSVATSLATGVPVRDSQCGYTALARWALERIEIERVWKGYGYPNDLLARIAEKKIPIEEVVVRPIYRGEPSGVRAWHVGRIAWLLAKAARRRASTTSRSGRD